jgi:hypothetical protein
MTTMPHGENSGADFSTGIPSAASQDACSQQPRSIIATASASGLTCDSPSSICVPTASAIILPAPRESRASRDRGAGLKKLRLGRAKRVGGTRSISRNSKFFFCSPRGGVEGRIRTGTEAMPISNILPLESWAVDRLIPSARNARSAGSSLASTVRTPAMSITNQKCDPQKRPVPVEAKSVSEVECPLELSPTARREWDRLTPQLAAEGRPTPFDRGPLAAYCTAAEVWHRDKPPNGHPVQSLYLSIVNSHCPSHQRDAVFSSKCDTTEWNSTVPRLPKSSMISK